MKNVVIDSSKLKEKLTENLEKHDKVYNEAVESYWLEVEKKLSSEVYKARQIIKSRDISKGGVSISIYINAPENHEEDYKTTLNMLEYNEGITVTLTREEFNAYILNKWSWADSFLVSNSRYASSDTLTAFSGTV